MLAVGPEPELPWLLDLAPVAPPTRRAPSRSAPSSAPAPTGSPTPTALTRTTWTVSSRSDRVGMRLEGEPLRRTDKRELPSEGMVRGAIQVPPGGEPVVFLADHPVTGGYPVVAVVVDADVDRAAQVRPGQSVRFRTRGGPVIPSDARARFRDGLVTPTAGWCDGYTQANLISVPARPGLGLPALRPAQPASPARCST